LIPTMCLFADTDTSLSDSSLVSSPPGVRSSVETIRFSYFHPLRCRVS
jgi:hypothetical protein